LSELEGSEVLEERRGEGVDLRGADAFRGKGEILLVVVDESLERIAKLLPNDLSALRDELLWEMILLSVLRTAEGKGGVKHRKQERGTWYHFLIQHWDIVVTWRRGKEGRRSRKAIQHSLSEKNFGMQRIRAVMVTMPRTVLMSWWREKAARGRVFESSGANVVRVIIWLLESQWGVMERGGRERLLTVCSDPQGDR
jgi:hypothetical protein